MVNGISTNNYRLGFFQAMNIGKPVEIIQLPAVLSGEDVLPGFQLQM